METINISKGLETRIKQLFNNNNEISGYFLAVHEDDQIKLVEGIFSECKENDADLKNLPSNYVELVRQYPNYYELIPSHFHSRSYGHNILIFDPYWTISTDYGNFIPGNIIGKEFYVSKGNSLWKRRKVCDSMALEVLCESIKDQLNIKVSKELFVHPAHGSEGRVMKPDLVEISCYGCSPSSEFGVERIPVEISDSDKKYNFIVKISEKEN
ncbi:MAG: hypothetical protein KJ623_04805 [Nanoarchaeota archaeon]|nr:hypothetical protein [Nanoarchaeota archaeon]